MLPSKGLDSFNAYLEPILSQMGYSCVQVVLRGGNSPLLQIVIERTDETPISIEDCTVVTKKVLDLLEKDDPIGGDYHIEVSSPGLDRPLVKRQDFERFKGSYAQFFLYKDLKGEKKVKGKILDVIKDEVMLEIEQDGQKEIFEISLENIKKANLKTFIED